MTVENSKQMWNALDGVEETINRLLAVRDVVSLNTLPNEEIVKLIDAMVNLFSDKQKIVWDEYRKQQEIHGPEFAKHYRQLTNDYIELETKYNKLALYDTRDQHIEDLTKENTELLQNNEKLNQQIRELVIKNEFYRDQSNRFRDECERLQEKCTKVQENYDNMSRTISTISQYPSHD